MKGTLGVVLMALYLGDVRNHFSGKRARQHQKSDNTLNQDGRLSSREQLCSPTLLSSAGRAQDCNCKLTLAGLNRGKPEHLEARGSIPRGETLLLLLIAFVLVLYWSCCGKSKFYGHRENLESGKPTFDSGTTKAWTSV
jgi:hypothetical protein